MAITLGPNRYGKAETRLVHVDRGGDEHRLTDLNVSIALSGDLDATHLTGDNSGVLPTDTMKNTVYAFAREHGVGQPEAFGLRLARHFAASQAQIHAARVDIEAYGWHRLGPHSFTRDGAETRLVTAVVDGGGERVVSGLTDLVLLNSTASEFHGFPRDRYTTLEETTERILATAVRARWRHTGVDTDFSASYEGVREALVAGFTRTYSLSLQQTLLAMGSHALRTRPEVAEIRLSLPNRHHLLVDLAPFGLDNRNEVYQVADRPYGLIEGTVGRDDVAPMTGSGEVDFLRPGTLDEALAMKAAHPQAVPIAGGTDVMVELNFDRRRPPALLDLTAVRSLAEWGTDGAELRLGAGVPYRRVIDEAAGELPGLAMASRTVGSPQIRNRGTVGGNLGSASPAGDAHPPLLAGSASVELASVRGTRRVPVDAFFTGPKRSVLAPDELITAVLVPPAAGPQQFAKVGTRNAMVIAVCSFAVALDPAARRVGTGIGSAAPTPLRAPLAEELLAAELPWQARGALDDDLARRFGELVGQAATPIDDVRGTAAYRRHALAVLARRTLGWAWQDYRKDAR